jgi:hypothetical protein
VLGNAAHALAGMMSHPAPSGDQTKPALGLTMFGVTTTCVQAVTKRLADEYDCLVFHATGVGGQSMEKLVESGLLEGVIDVSTTEIADEIGEGTLSAGPTRLDVFAQRPVPYVGSCGALDMVNFGAWESVPERFRGRTLYRHNPNVTLMRTTVDENRRIGAFIAGKLNAMQGPVRFLIPEGGVSAIDKPGQPFHSPGRGRALFEAIASGFRTSASKKLVRLPLHVNDERSPTRWSRPGARSQPSRRPPAPAADKKDIAHAAHRPPDPARPLPRQDRAAPAHHRRRRRHGPVGQVRGGGRHRPHRHLQLGPLPDGRARLAGRPARLRQRQRDRLRDGARGAAGGEEDAGPGRGQRHRPVHDPRRLLQRLIGLGFSGIQNFPSVGLIDGTFRANLEETGMGYGLEVRAGGRARSTC